MIEKGLDDTEVSSLLCTAARCRNAYLIQCFIDEGADPNRKCLWGGCTPLVRAVHSNHVESVRVMLGARVGVSTENLCIAFLFAYIENDDVAEVILRRLLSGLKESEDFSRGRTDFLRQGLDFVLQTLPDAGPWFSVGSPLPQYTLLVQAVLQNRVGLVQRLLSKGAAPCMITCYGPEASNRLFIRDIGVLSKDVLGALVNAGMDICVADGHNETLLHRAVQKGNVAVIRELVRLGCDVEAKDRGGRTPLLYYVLFRERLERRPLLDVLESLKTAGANMHAKDLEGNTALHYSCGPKKGFFDHDRRRAVWRRGLDAQWLLHQGLDPRSKNMAGDTALDCAICHLARPDCPLATATNLIPIVLLIRKALAGGG